MTALKIVNVKGESVGELALADGWPGAGRGEQAVADAVTAILANRRAGTAATKGKGTVAGSNKKPWRQKGTGRARAGYRQSPVWRGGGVVFGPKPRSYATGLNKKTARVAFGRALADRAASGAVTVLEALSLDQPKTRAMAAILKAVKADRGALVVIEAADRNVALAARNLPGVEVATADALNTYQVLRHRSILVTRAALERIERRLAGKKEASS
jgi:large subunit ribosomal protein L4